MRAERLHVNERTAQIIRVAGFVIPTILIFYGILIQLGAVVAPDKERHDVLFYTIAAGWTLMGIHQFLIPSRSKRESVIRLMFYHLFTILYVLFISGFAMPFIGFWTVLFLASYAYLAHDGLRMSIFVLFATSLADVLLHIDNPDHVIANVLALIATFTVGMVAVSIGQAQEVDYMELSRSQKEEVLQRDRILTIVNNLADAVLSTDRRGKIQLYNAATLGLLDTNAGLVGVHIDDILNLADRDKKVFKLSSNFKSTTSVQTRDDLSATIGGEVVRLNVIYAPIRSPDSRDSAGDDGYIVILRDITKQKSLEEERDEFISVVSHELRTPITIAEGTLSNVQLMVNRQDIPKTTLSDNIHVAHEQVMFLAKMVNDLSTLSRAERGIADAVEAINVSELIHDLYNEYAPQAEAKGLHFNLDLAPSLGEVVASRLYLKELLQNFVTNAIKYTKKGDILVSVTKKGDILQFNVRDSGIGISKSDQKRIFEKFFRSEDYRTRETGGTGLGLYVAKKLSKKLGAEISMTSRLNHGSTFGFSLPVAYHEKKTK